MLENTYFTNSQRFNHASSWKIFKKLGRIRFLIRTFEKKFPNSNEEDLNCVCNANPTFPEPSNFHESLLVRYHMVFQQNKIQVLV